MNKHLRTTAFTAISLLIAFLSSSEAFAQSIKVLQVKGKRAIVEFNGMEPRLNQSYLLGEDAMIPDAGDRTKTLGFSGELISVSSAGTNLTVLGASGLYGWIHPGGKMEYGPTLSFASVSRSGTSNNTTRTTFGGFFDYNLVPNLANEKLIYGATATLSYGMASTGGVSSNVITIEAGGVMKWFFAKSTTALRTGVVLTHAQTSGSGSNTTDSGFKLFGGLQFFM